MTRCRRRHVRKYYIRRAAQPIHHQPVRILGQEIELLELNPGNWVNRKKIKPKTLPTALPDRSPKAFTRRDAT